MKNTSTPSIRWLLALLAAPMLLCSPLSAADKTPVQFPAKKTHTIVLLPESGTVQIANPGPNRTGLRVIIKRVPEAVFRKLAPKAPDVTNFEYTVNLTGPNGLSQKQSCRCKGTALPGPLKFSFPARVTGPLEIQVLMAVLPAAAGSSDVALTSTGNPVTGGEIYIELEPDDTPD